MSEAVKTFVIDTNVFIHRPEAIHSFRDNEIVIPLWVLEELDNLKKERDERGRNARETIRLLDEISRHGDLREGVRLENGSTVRVELGRHDGPENLPADLAATKNDNKILATAYALQRAGRRVFFVSKDISARLKATALGLKAVDYEKQKVNIQTLYRGFVEQDASHETLKALRADGWVPSNTRLAPNEFVVLKEAKSEDTALARFDGQGGPTWSWSGTSTR